MQRHAYLIAAHNQFTLLEMLLKGLDHPQNDFYLHIDAKVKDFDFAYFSGLCTHSRVYFTPRLSISWGSYSQVQLQLVLLKSAMAVGYGRYHNLSGVDLPLQSAQSIVDFFAQYPNQEFIHYSSPEFCQSSNARDRVRYYHWLQRYAKRGNGAAALVKRGLIKLQRMLGVDRLKRLEGQFKCGAAWYSITHALAEYVVSREGWIKKHFGCALSADECFLHTLVWNSPFRQALHMPNDREDHRSCRRYIIWDRQTPGEPFLPGQPYVFRDGDLPELTAAAGAYLFARKFDYVRFPAICRQVATLAGQQREDGL